MEKSLSGQRNYFEAFIKSAQYLAGLTAQQDIWSETGKVLVNFFEAEVGALEESRTNAEAAGHRWVFSERYSSRTDLEAETREVIAEVLESGFLSSRIIFTPDPLSIACFPISRKNQVVAVMVVGHRMAEPLPRQLLDVYLAVASLVGTISERLASEQERERTEKAQQTIKENEYRLQTILDLVLTGLLIIDIQTHEIVDANSTAVEMIGAPKDEIIGKVCHTYVCPAELGKCPVTDLGGTVDKSERVLVKADGTEIEIMKSITSMKINNREYLIESFIDISQRKQAEQELKKLNQDLESTIAKVEGANDNLKKFVYIASHDLREPLRKIASFGTMLNESLSGKLCEDDAENLGYMIDGAERMTQMIEGLLSYSRVSTQGQPAEIVELNELLEQLQEFELCVLIEEKNVIIEIPEQLPLVKADSVQLRQLLQNLIANGIKYQKKNSTPRITVTSCPADDGMVRIEVADNGIGIKPQYQATVFEMFRRLHSRSEYEGTGIGLSVCKKIVERQGGQIGVESEYGKGSTFWFTVPAAEQLATIVV